MGTRQIIFFTLAVVVALSVGVAVGARAAGGTRVVTDEAAGVVRVMVKGKEMLRVDEEGVHILNGGWFPARISGDAWVGNNASEPPSGSANQKGAGAKGGRVGR